MKTVTRREAQLAGKTRYFTGKPCPHGHVAQRFVGNKNCVECSYIRRDASRAT